MPEIKIEVDNDTLAALALGAMHDGVTMNEYVTTCVTELAKVIEVVVATDEPEVVAEESIPGKAPEAQPAVEDNIGVAPTIEQSGSTSVNPEQKPGGKGAPLYAKKENNRWTI